jgi:hypothetical protein
VEKRMRWQWGSPVSPLKIKIKKKKIIFYGTTGAKIYFHKLKYLISQNYLIYIIHLHDQHARAHFPQKNSFYFGL